MLKWLSSLLLMTLLPLFADGQYRELDLRNITLADSEGKSEKLAIRPGKPVVFIILGVDCPISQKYIPGVEELRVKFLDKVDWIAIFPKYFSAEEVALFKKEYGLKIKSYIDQDMQLIKRLNAHVTPEVFLVDTDLIIKYSGAIDDWFYDLGRYRAKVTNQYLKNAIDSLIGGKEIEMSSATAIGCPIEITKSNKPAHTHH